MRMCRITSQQGQPVTFKTEFQTVGIFLFQAHGYGTTSVMSANWSICTLSDAYNVNGYTLVMSSEVETSLRRFLHSLRSVGMTTSVNMYIIPKKSPTEKYLPNSSYSYIQTNASLNTSSMHSHRGLFLISSPLNIPNSSSILVASVV